MSNIFKLNSRFSVLSEDINDNTVFKKNNNKKQDYKKETPVQINDNSFLREENSFKRDYNNRNYNRDYFSKENKERIEKEYKLKREQEKLKKEEQDKKNLARESFPDFIPQKSINSDSPNNLQMDYKEKVSVIVEKKTHNIVNPIKPGWVEIKRDTKNKKKPIYTYGEEKNNIVFDTSHYQVLESLVKLHNKRTDEYIDMWGYDSWEKMFRFPNYDYEYFNNLDELYELEMEEEMNIIN
jgi:hypothetical protein